MVEQERHNRRDNDRITKYFGKVDGFHCPPDYLRMVECAHNKVNVIVDYCFAPYTGQSSTWNTGQSSTWNTGVSCVWDSGTKDCTTYVSGKPKYLGEDAYLDALYRCSGITNGRKPAPAAEVVNGSIIWLSARHRLCDRFASAMDIDAWSTTSSGPINWDFKFFCGSWSTTEERVLNILGQHYPIFKVKYSLKEGEWYARDVGDWAEIIPCCEMAEEIADIIGLPGAQLSIEDATVYMSLIVRQYEA